jgi:hypothetical protein
VARHLAAHLQKAGWSVGSTLTANFIIDLPEASQQFSVLAGTRIPIATMAKRNAVPSASPNTISRLSLVSSTRVLVELFGRRV